VCFGRRRPTPPPGSFEALNTMHGGVISVGYRHVMIN
jgi:hypothetical protein